MTAIPTLRDRFSGCLLGLMLGDSLGFFFEGWPAEDIAAEYPTAASLLDRPPLPPPWPYTDDTEMAIGVAEALVQDGEIRPETVCAAWGRNYTRGRPYGATRLVLEAISQGGDYRTLARTLFPGGSYGNGAAMRVAPVGLFFHHDLDLVWEQAERSALPTHVHPLAIEGAQLVALAVALAVADRPLERDALFDELLRRCRTPEYRTKLAIARGVSGPAELSVLGNSVRAIDSAVTAIACFSLFPDNGVDAIATAILLGGDTDTIAAMAGAIAGARCGAQSIPSSLLGQVEDGLRGRTYVATLAERLYEAYAARQPAAVEMTCSTIPSPCGTRNAFEPGQPPALNR